MRLPDAASGVVRENDGVIDFLAAPPADGSHYQVVALGAHADDLEIGAGGTITSLLAAYPETAVHWLVLSATDQRREEAISSAQALLGRSLAELYLHEFRDGFVPADWGAVKDALRRVARQVRPDLVLAPSVTDLHQDHRALAELAWQVFRGALILEYEIPKWDGDLSRPSLYVPLADDVVASKVEHLRRHFRSQLDKPWFDDELFRAILRIRGMECGIRYAEAFHARKLVLRW
jgi:LmbE family N-acetylglucosaminyl deacetylase